MREVNEDLKMLDFFERIGETKGEHNVDEMRRLISKWVLDLYSDFEELEDQNEKLTEKLNDAEEVIQDLQEETHLGRGAF